MELQPQIPVDQETTITTTIMEEVVPVLQAQVDQPITIIITITITITTTTTTTMEEYLKETFHK